MRRGFDAYCIKKILSSYSLIHTNDKSCFQERVVTTEFYKLQPLTHSLAIPVVFCSGGSEAEQLARKANADLFCLNHLPFVTLINRSGQLLQASKKCTGDNGHCLPGFTCRVSQFPLRGAGGFFSQGLFGVFLKGFTGHQFAP
jgi:hypothetical protein